MKSKITIIIDETQRSFIDEITTRLTDIGVPTSLSKVARKVFERGWDNIDRDQCLANPLSLFTNGGE